MENTFMDDTSHSEHEPLADTGTAEPSAVSDVEAFVWLEHVLPVTMRRLMDSDNLDIPLLQLPLAQLRLAQALYHDDPEQLKTGQTMGKLSEKLGVKQNALTQAADRLVNHSLAERLSDPNDRRVVRLRLTVQGKEWVSQRRARRRARLVELWNHLNGHERKDLLAAVKVIESAVSRLDPQANVEYQNSVSRKSQKTLPILEETLSQLAEPA